MAHIDIGVNSAAIHRPTGSITTTRYVLDSKVSSSNSRSERVEKPIKTIAFPSPPEIFIPKSGLTPKSLYAQIAIALLSGARVEVHCAGPWSLNKVRCAVRARVEKNGHEMRSTKLGYTLWMELKA